MRERKGKEMNTLHSTWRRIRTVIADMNYAANRLTDPRVK
jgi:hypothetical protein